MRKVLLFALLFVSAISFSQAPQLLNYQAVARDASGNIITTAIGVRFEILQGSASGTLVYEETNTIIPSSAGIFTTGIGSGTPVSGTFSLINWANAPYFIRVGIDPTGGTSYSTVGTSQLLSVPYALYAEKAGNTQTVNITGPNVTGAFPNYTITAPAPLTAGAGISISGGTITNTAPSPTLIPSGITSISGSNPSFTIDVPPPSLNYNTGTNVLTLTQGTAVATTTLVGAGSNTVAMFAQGIASVNPVGAGSSFTVSVQSPTFTPSGPTTITGTYPNYTINSPAATPATTVIAGTNVTVGGTGPTYTVNSTPTLSIGSGSISISGGNAVLLPVAPAQTSVNAGTNITIGGSAPNYTVNTPTYSLNFSNSSTGNLTNGINSSAVSLPQPTLTLSGANNNVISAGSNSITIATYTAVPGSGLLVGGAFPNFSLSTTSTGTAAPWNTLGNTGTNPTVNFLGTTDAQDLVFKTANNQRMRIYNSSGNVGIGNITTSSELLQVETGSNTAASILSGTNSTLYFGNSVNHFLGAVQYNTINNTMSFWTNNTADRIFINALGRVGLGTNIPAADLDVAGSLRLGTSRLFLGPVGGINSGYTGIYENGGDLRFAVFQSGAVANPPFASGGNSFDAMTIKSTNGYVGIGTTSPGNPLHIKTSTSGSYLAYESTVSGTSPFGLHFISPAQDYYLMQGPGTGPANALAIYDGTAASMRFVLMPGTGRIGIGTSAPASLLHVNGQITMTDGSQGDGKVLVSNTAGNATWAKGTDVIASGAISCQNIGTVTATPAMFPVPLISFTKVSANSIIEVTMQTDLNVFQLMGASNAVRYELRVNGNTSVGNTGKATYFLQNGGTFSTSSDRSVTMIGIFTGLAPGTYQAELWASSPAGGSAINVYIDPGCFGASSVIVKEIR